jgi:hypothetical protein
VNTLAMILISVSVFGLLALTHYIAFLIGRVSVLMLRKRSDSSGDIRSSDG